MHAERVGALFAPPRHSWSNDGLSSTRPTSVRRNPRSGTTNADIWTCNISLGTYLNNEPVDAEADALQQFLNTTVAPALRTWFTSTNLLLLSTAKMTFAKLNAIDPSGTTSTSPGPSSTASRPLQQAAPWRPAPTSTRGSARWCTPSGASHSAERPLVAASTSHARLCMNTDGTWVIPAQSATATKTLLDTISGATVTSSFGADQFVPVIASPGTTRNGGVGVNNVITTVEVDSVPDIQRRRANKLRGAVITATLNNSGLS